MMKVSKRLFSLLLIGAFMFSLFGFKEFNSVKTLEVSASGDSDGCNDVAEDQVSADKVLSNQENEPKGTENQAPKATADGKAPLEIGNVTGVTQTVEPQAPKAKFKVQTSNLATGSTSISLPQAAETLGTVELSGSKFTADADKVSARGDTKVVAQFWTTEAKDKAPLEIGIGTGVAKTVEPQAPKATLEVQTTNLAERSASISLPQAAEAQALNLATGSTSISLHQGANEVTANEGKLPKVYNRAAIGDLRNYGSQKFSNFTTHDDDYLSDEGTASKNNIVSQAVQSILVRSTTEQNYVLNLLG